MKSNDLQKKINFELLGILNNLLKKYGIKSKVKDLNEPFYSNGHIDSLDFVNLIELVEKKYNFKFKLSEIDINTSLSTLSKTILKKMK